MKHLYNLIIATIAVAAFLLPVQSQARIGETLKECIARYGKPVQDNRKDGLVQFEFQGFTITVEGHKGRVVSIIYMKMDPETHGFEIPAREVLALLKKHAPEWRNLEAAHSWETPNGSLCADYIRGSLCIYTRGHMERALAKAEAKAMEEASRKTKGL